MQNLQDEHPQAHQLLSQAHRVQPERCSFNFPPLENCPYNSTVKVGPTPSQLDMNKLVYGQTDYQRSPELDFVWQISRLTQQEKTIQTVPACSGFNGSITRQNIPQECVIGYCFTLKSSPTEPSSLHTNEVKSGNSNYLLKRARRLYHSTRPGHLCRSQSYTVAETSRIQYDCTLPGCIPHCCNIPGCHWQEIWRSRIDRSK